MSLGAPAEFVHKWSKVALSERSACQQHFLDLCALVGHPTPAEADPSGQDFCFERGVEKADGGSGWADVWKRGFFAIEYKGRHKDLAKAYQQLAQYRESLDNPPLLVVCDMDRIEVHTNFTGTAKRRYVITLETLGEPASIEILRNVFFHPERLRPGATSEAITADAASRMAQIAVRLRERFAAQDAAAASTVHALGQREAAERLAGLGQQLAQSYSPHAVARFLDRVVFCLFAEDIELLPDHLFTKIIRNSRGQPDRFVEMASRLFETMAKGGTFGFDVVPYFNGNLFDGNLVLPLNEDEIELVYQASVLDWSSIDPSILGALFERGLDPDSRAKLGAHYTSRADIETLVDPVVMAPLRREWDEVRAQIDSLVAKGGKAPRQKAASLAHGFLDRLGKLRFLDPACGSGNFLFVTLQRVKDLEKEVNIHLAKAGLDGFLPVVGPWQFYGIETNPYAAELAQMTLWIGYLQWTRANGFGIPDSPVLSKLDNITCGDAILRLDKDGKAYEPEWPQADFIVGNPPFLGGSKFRRELGPDYRNALVDLYVGRVPGGADLCCYWFEKARAMVAQNQRTRVGLIGTQAIRGGANRKVLQRIKESGGIFFAIGDREWTLDGAAVRISMVGFDAGSGKSRLLDGKQVAEINANLSAGADSTSAARLESNADLSFRGVEKNGGFDIAMHLATQMLSDANPHGRPNSDVLRPLKNAHDLVGVDSGRWLIDFGVSAPASFACPYSAPFDHLKAHVQPVRSHNNRSSLRERWWIHGESRPALRAAVAGMRRFIVTPEVSKHRIFSWLDAAILPDKTLVVIAFGDDARFGVLQSRAHEVWARAQGTQLREAASGFRYTPTTCFETFPFPQESAAQYRAIEKAAVALCALRDRWLNPPEWTETCILEFPGTAGGPWSRYIDASTVNAKTGIGTVRYPLLEPKDAACAAKLKKRTLTALYNERPAWLDNAHKALDAVVADAYGWPDNLTDEQILEHLLALNLERSVA